jgi:hypothetical protein
LSFLATTYDNRLIIDTGLTSYKLSRFICDYINEHRPDIRDLYNSADAVQDVINSSRETPKTKHRVVTSRTARNWLKKLGYSWKDVTKDVFVDGHERDDVVRYRKEFLDTMDSLLPFIVEFNEDGTMKEKEYPIGCHVGGPDRPIVLITHDESIFSANDGRHQAWIEDGSTFLRPKGKGKGIMVSDFLLLESSISPEREAE